MNSRFSDAALAYWAKVYPGNNLRIPTISTYDAALAAFDAGCAHALATVTPRTISTESELDALPVGQKVEDCDGDGYAKNKNGEWECYSVDHRRVWISEALAMYAPLTLLVPATAAPEPVRLTADDPRWKDGAKVRGEFADGSAVEGAVDGKRVLYAQIQPSLGTFYWERAMFDVIYLITEAPAAEDPRVEVLAAALHDRGGCEDEWPTCAISTLEHYRNAARNLLPILDGARADQ